MIQPLWSRSCLDLSGVSVKFKGKNVMKTWRDIIAGALFVCCLSIGINSVAQAAHQHWSCDYSRPPFRQDKSELRRDEKALESDVNVLRKLLRHHGSQERIARLRYLVRQDWSQIVLDRGQSRPCPEDQSQNLVNRVFIETFRAGGVGGSVEILRYRSG